MKSKNGKTIRKISLFAALIALITMVLAVSVMAEETPHGVQGNLCYTYGDVDQDGILTEDDAMYLLYHSVFGEDEYPVEYYECDGDIIGKNALEVLAMVGSDNLITVHAYGEPLWQWTEEDDTVSVTAIYSCACGATSELEVEAAEVDVIREQATCTKAGSVIYKASAKHDGVTYETEKVAQTTAALGHTYEENLAKCADHTCLVCGDTDAGSAHEYGDGVVVAATCTTEGTTTYTCNLCNEASYTEVTSPALGHVSSGDEHEVLADASTCEYKEVYTCSTCENEVDGDSYHKHVPAATLVDDADCSHEGKKVVSCAACKTYIEDVIIPVDENAHTWDTTDVASRAASGVVTYNCTDCDATKTVVDASGVSEATLSSSILEDVKEIDVNGTSLTLDEGLVETLDGEVSLKAETLTSNEVDALLDDEFIKQMEGCQVYNFSLSVKAEGSEEAEAITNFKDTPITIQLPYNVTGEEDIDSVGVWYIDEKGNPDVIKGASYSNGYVTFTTEHFSYYTVTRLTPEQRCATYGHSKTTTTVDPTCTKDGYSLMVCARCAYSEKTVAEGSALGHDITESLKAATCTTAGTKKVTCANGCGFKSTTTIPATGHDWEECSEEPTCKEAKVVSIGCRVCDSEKTITLPQEAHVMVDKSEVPATCETNGYKLSVCEGCGLENREGTTLATGHSYTIEWGKFDEGNLTMEGKLHCTNTGCEKELTRNASVTLKSVDVEATCDKAGSKTYEAKIVYGGNTYRTQKTVTTSALGHKMSSAWSYDENSHYHQCSRCEYKEGFGSHTFVDSKCTVCGYNLTDCKHDVLYTRELDVSKYDLCVDKIYYNTCACGQHVSMHNIDADHEWTHHIDSPVFDNSSNIVSQVSGTSTCANCDLRRVYRQVGTVVGSKCEVEYVYSADYTVNGENILNEYNKWVSTEPVHNMVIVGYDCEGESCEDGVTYIQECTRCGATNTFTENTHRNVVLESYDTSEYGMCGGKVEVVGCACGDYRSVMEASRCAWDYQSSEEVEDGWLYTYKCLSCGSKRVQSTTTEDINECISHEIYENEYFDPTGKSVFSVERVRKLVNHTIRYEFDLNGTTCSDGYTVTESCINCDHENTYTVTDLPEGYHSRYYTQMNLADYGFCGGYIQHTVCACGEVDEVYTNHYYCSWEDQGVNEATGAHVYKCMSCESSYEYLYTIENPDSCHSVEKNNYKFYTKDGKFVDEVTRVIEYTSHEMIATFEKNGTSCEDGYTVTETCQKCGEESSFTRDYHEAFRVAHVDLTDYGFCGGEVDKYSCACGEYAYDYGNTYSCWWNDYVVDEKTGDITYTCEYCKNQKTEHVTIEKDDNCYVNKTTTIKLYKADGTFVASYDEESSYLDHTYVYSFEMKDSSNCEAGYYVTETCRDCDYTWTSSYEKTDHYTYLKTSYDASELGLCSGTIRYSECPCGKVTSVDTEINCNWEYDINAEQTVCKNCNSVYKTDYVKIDVDECHYQNIWSYTYFTKDGVKILSLNDIGYYSNHDYIYTLTLDNPDGDCHDGYKAIGVCTVCQDETESSGEWHSMYVTDKTVIGEESGVCGMVVSTQQCACGYNGSIGADGECNFYVYSDGNGNMCYECNECKATIVYEESFGEKDAECYAVKTTVASIYDADKDLLYQGSVNNVDIRHSYEDVRVELNDPKDCTKGYTVYTQCEDCLDEYAMEYYGSHYDKLVGSYALTGACGTGAKVDAYNCLCGQSAYINWSLPECNYVHTPNNYPDDDGVAHHVDVYSCDDCGARISQDKVYEYDTQNCTVTTKNTVTITVGTTAVTEPFTLVSTSEWHDRIESVRLENPDSGDCNDGVIITYTCKNCGDSYESSTYGHHDAEKARYDLKKYGSVCGGDVILSECACGEYKDIEFADNVECDWYYNSIIDEYEYEGQYTTSGWTGYFNKYGYLYRCPVTTPACGFGVLVTTYHEWDEDTCMMVSYESWKLGYEDDGSFDEEIVIETGRIAYHDYESKTSTDGATVTQTCKQCGSTYIRTDRYDSEGRPIEQTIEATNTRSDINGEYRYMKESWIDVYYKGYDFPVYRYDGWIYADGSDYYNEYTYEYNWDNFDCTRMVYRTSSYDTYEPYQEDCHKETYNSEWTYEGTCSQPWDGWYNYTCNICSEVTDSGEQHSSPNGHSYRPVYSDDYTEILHYVCYNCGLENYNGSDGTIIMEDLTESHGNGKDYVVGYYNRSAVDFTYEACVLVETQQIPLDEFKDFVELSRENGDEVNAISFNKADVEAAALAALVANGYAEDADYAIQFVMIPWGSDGDFDYAITFTDESISGTE